MIVILQKHVKKYCKCERGKCVKKNGKLVCECPPEFALLTSSMCKACNCGKGNNCTIESSGYLGFKTTITCICKEGYKADGDICIGPCSDNPCKNKGDCIDIKNGYKCNCTKGYVGTNCENKDYCETNPCQNGGTCQNDKSSYKCICPIEYSGKTCTTKEYCAKSPCKNGGTCKALTNGYKCTCPPGYLDDQCTTIETCMNSKLKTCEIQNKECMTVVDSVIICGHCLPNYVEDQEGQCVEETCGNSKLKTCEIQNRECLMVVDNVMTCGHCLTNYLEDQDLCVEDPCSHEPCQNNGICKVENNTSVCYCRKPYYGHACEKDSCSNNPCNNNGICIMVHENFVCFCRHPFYGNTCEREYNPFTFESTLLISTSTPGITTTRNISMDTTYEPSYNLTTKQWTTIDETNTTSYEQTTTVTPEQYEFTSEGFANFTNIYNQTFEPWNTTVNYYSTTGELLNHTQYLTTEKVLSNVTTGYNQTSEMPLDFTVTYNETKDDLDITTATPVSTDATSTPKSRAKYILRHIYSIRNLTELVIEE